MQWKNIRLRTNSDTEALLETISCFGLDGIKKVYGMFSFVLYDKEKNSFFLFRDRLGIKPLFYNYDGNKIIFWNGAAGLFVAPITTKDCI